MKKFIITLLLCFLLPVVSMAADAGGDISEMYFQKKNPELTPQELSALAIAEKWQKENANGMKPVAGAYGDIRFVFGTQQPNVVCAVLQVCDVELQTGEQLNSLHLGDQARWLVEPAITGSGPTEVQHLIIKPLDVGLKTSLVVTTNRRTYHINLVSSRTDFMPQVGFIYPDEARAKWNQIKDHETKEKKERTIPQTGEYLGDLNFAYDIAGNASWKPVRVYKNGQKTIIQMPTTMAQTEAPTLLMLRKDGGIFTDDETVMVNYRLQGDRYIVDTVFDKAILIAGVGKDQDRVTITREK